MIAIFEWDADESRISVMGLDRYAEIEQFVHLVVARVFDVAVRGGNRIYYFEQ